MSLGAEWERKPGDDLVLLEDIGEEAVLNALGNKIILFYFHLWFVSKKKRKRGMWFKWFLFHVYRDLKHTQKKTESRYRASEIYTGIGPVLIALNPYRLYWRIIIFMNFSLNHLVRLLQKNGKSIYDPSVVKVFERKQYIEMTPHTFAVAEEVSPFSFFFFVILNCKKRRKILLKLCF